MVFYNCSMFCCALLFVHSSVAIIWMGKRELVALLCLSSWCLVIVVWLFFTMSRVCLQFVIVIFSDHTHYYFSLVHQCWVVIAYYGVAYIQQEIGFEYVFLVPLISLIVAIIIYNFRFIGSSMLGML